MKDFKVLLIGLYNYKALGVRYLAAELEDKGYPCEVLFFKNFKGSNVKKPTQREYEMLVDLIRRINPDLIGLSVMSTLYMDAVMGVNACLRENFPDKKIIWGGVFATLFPEEALKHADFIMRGEGERAFVEFVDSLAAGRDYTGILNLGWRDASGVRINDLRPFDELDGYKNPILGGERRYYIDDDKLVCGDPQLESPSYEMAASRGCPFSCSYCNNVNIRRVYAGKGKYVRQRSVDNVIQELVEAKQKMKNLKMVRFWDEIFTDEISWIKDFVPKYRKFINLPFEIWGHPLRVNDEVIGLLVQAGLNKVVVGIQHGSLKVRRDYFHRPESQEQVIECSRILAKHHIPEVIYDFILDHPFEAEEDLRETFELCMKLHHPFKLQLHGLSFLPGTDIIQIGIDKGFLTEESVREQQAKPLEDQYRINYWWIQGSSGVSRNNTFLYWSNMIYFTQFKSLQPFLRKLVNSAVWKENPAILVKGQKVANYFLLAQKALNKLKVYRKGASRKAGETCAAEQ